MVREGSDPPETTADGDSSPSGDVAVLTASTPRRGLLSRVVRALALVASLLLVAAAQHDFAQPLEQATGWWLALAAIVVGLAWQFGFAITDWTRPAGRHWGWAPQWWRWALGGALLVASAALWIDASRRLSASWPANFDRAWVMWFLATPLMSLGFRVLQTPLSEARNRLSRWEWVALAVSFVVATGFHLGNFENFPPADAVSQVEELQAGQSGVDFLNGDREHWEFQSQAAIAALGIWLGGPTLRSVRESFAVVNLLKVVPAYFWFRALAGPAGAMTGTALLAFSGWDSIINRIPGHPDGLIAMLCLALLAGPVVRGSWAAYPWVGLLAGYSTLTYIAFRPLVGLALAGVVIAALAQSSLRDWRRWWKALPPLVLVSALIAGIFVPLFYRLPGERFAFEYLNGWNRARGVEDYYGPRDTWQVALHKRWERTQQAAGLFYTEGDTNATHNVDARTEVDRVTGSLMILGIGYCLVMCWRGFYGVALAGFVITFLGTLVFTGNFDVLRAQACIQYVYTLAAVGAGALYAGARRSFGRVGALVAGLLLAGGVAWAGYWNGTLLHDLWTSPTTQRHYRNDLAYLSEWLRQNAQGRPVVGLIPTGANVVFIPNDSAWLRGPDVTGTSAWDVRQALDKLARHHDEALLLISAPKAVPEIAEYFQYMLPSAHFQLRTDPWNGDVRMAYASIADPAVLLQSASFQERLCHGIRATFVIYGRDGRVISSSSSILPFIDTTTWPGAVRAVSFEHEQDGKSIDVVWEGDFTVPESGSYVFFPECYEGRVVATIDQTHIGGNSQLEMTLAAGPHHFEMRGQFNVRMVDPTARLSWRPAGGGEFRVVPFYRMTQPDPACLGQPAEPVASGLPQP